MVVAGWQKRKSLFFFLYLLCGFIVLLGNNAELHAKTAQQSLLACRITYVFIAFFGVAWVVFVREWQSRRSPPTRVLLPLISIVPIVTSVIQLTGDPFHLIWRSYRFITVGNFLINDVREYGPWFAVHVAYSYGLLAWGIQALILKNHRQWRLYQLRDGLLILAAILPASANFLYLGRAEDTVFWDISSSLFCFSGLLFSVAMLRYNFFDSPPPPARALFMEVIDEGYTILDTEGRIADINPCAMRHFQLNAAPIGKPIVTLHERLGEAMPYLRQDGQPKWTGAIGVGGAKLFLKLTPYPDHTDRPRDWFLLVSRQIANSPSYPTENLDEIKAKIDSDLGLSGREREVLNALRSPLSNKDIENRLFISRNTLKTHITHINKKTGCQGRQDLKDRFGELSEAEAFPEKSDDHERV